MAYFLHIFAPTTNALFKCFMILKKTVGLLWNSVTKLIQLSILLFVKDSIGRILPMFLVFFHLFWSNIVSDVPSFPKGVVVITESNRITPIFTERNWFDPTPWIGDNYNISSERANLNEPKIYKWLLDNTDFLIVGFWTFIGKCM